MKISAYYTLYRDFELLAHSVESIYDEVDEIVLVDGAYDWVTEFYGGLPLTDPNVSAIGDVQFRGRPLLWAPKIKYIHRSWKSEYEKRTVGYEAASGDIVVPMDMDDVIRLDLAALEEFWTSPCRVASLSFVNIIRSYASMHESAEELGAEQSPDGQWIQRFFKKALVSAEEHLDFLWQLYRERPERPVDSASIFEKSMGHLDHLTLVRSRTGLLWKFLFYRAGHWRKTGTNDSILLAGGWGSYTEMLRDVSQEDYADLFLRLGPDSMRAPEARVVRPFHTDDRKLVSIAAPYDRPEDELALHPERGALAIPGLKIFAYVPPGRRLVIRADGIFSARVHYHPMRYDADNRSGILLRSGSDRWDEWDCELPELEEETIYARLVAFEPIRARNKLGRLLAVRAE